MAHETWIAVGLAVALVLLAIVGSVIAHGRKMRLAKKRRIFRLEEAPVQAEPIRVPPSSGRSIHFGSSRTIQLTAESQRALIRRGPPLSITHRTKALWEEKDWRRQGRAYVGQYRANGRRWRGRIEVPYPGGYDAYIWDPPLRELSNHPHRPCFRPNGLGGRYSVHFARTPFSLDHAITNVETVLREATGGSKH